MWTKSNESHNSEPGLKSARRLLPVLALAVILAFALWPRLSGYTSVPLWLDEAWRANLILDHRGLARLFDGSTYGGITSLTYAAIVRGLHAIHGTEDIIRLSSLVPGVVAVPLVYLIVALATRSIVIGLFAGLATSLSPWLIAYAKALKPYSFELCIHLLLVFLALSYAEGLVAGRQRRTDPWILSATAQFAALSASNIVFTLPGFYAAIALSQYRVHRRLSLWLVAAACCTAVLIIGQYFLIWSTVSTDTGLMEFWSDSFYDSNIPRIRWILGKLHDTVRASLVPIIDSRTPGWLIAANSITMTVGSIVGVAGSLSRTHPHRFFLFVSPILLTVSLNAAGMWPLGPIRVDLFLFGLLIVLVFVGYGFICSWIPVLRFALMPMLLVWYGVCSRPTVMQHFGVVRQDVPSVLRALMDDLGSHCSTKQLVLANSSASHAIAYYRDHHAVLSPLIASRLESCITIVYVGEVAANAAALEKTVGDSVRASPVFWFIYSHLYNVDLAQTKGIIARYGEITMERKFEGAGMFKVIANRERP
jgi:hypothetical protein